jgi:hypothetical protein
MRASLFSPLFGQRRVALARSAPDDPYQWANDSVVLVSHRYDVVPFWNGGATGSFPTMAPDGKHAVAHLLFYSNRGPDAASVRIAGRFRAAKAWTVEGALPGVETEIQKDAIENGCGARLVGGIENGVRRVRWRVARPVNPPTCCAPAARMLAATGRKFLILWWALAGSNRGPSGCKPDALTS